MSHIKQAQLKATSILTVPFQNYDKDFTFIVNGEEFKTSRLVAELLSPVISRIHLTDPTIDAFVIDTQIHGDFSLVLKLTNFELANFTEDEFIFLSEAVEILGNESIEYKYDKNDIELTINNVLSHLQKHEKYGIFYSNQLSKEIEFASSHFFELFEKEEMKKLSINSLMKIMSNDQLRLKNEDQLLKFVNKLYSNNSHYSILYENVLFSNVSSEAMVEFISIFDVNEMSNSMWKILSNRLCEEIVKKQENSNRYIKPGTLFEYNENKVLNGIFNYFQKKTNGQIQKEINFTSSSIINSSYQPINVVLYEKLGQGFESSNYQNSWICFDFKDRRVIPTHYTIRSYTMGPGNQHPKSWVIEGSEDGNKWDKIDEEKDCPHLNGINKVHTFSINDPKSSKFKFIRMRSTGKDWQNTNFLAIESFEIYGSLI